MAAVMRFGVAGLGAGWAGDSGVVAGVGEAHAVRMSNVAISMIPIRVHGVMISSPNGFGLVSAIVRRYRYECRGIEPLGMLHQCYFSSPGCVAHGLLTVRAPRGLGDACRIAQGALG